jgi:hypothetical protein
MDHTQSRRLLLNLALLLLVVGLGAFVWWQSNAQHKAPETLLGFGKADVTRITITRHPGTGKPDSIKLEKQGGHWQMLEPQQFAVNPTMIAQLFTLLDETVEASYDATGKDLKQYGLAPANVALSFNNETLLLGAENPVSHTRYFLHGGKIKLASEAVYGLLTGGVEEWRLAPP